MKISTMQLHCGTIYGNRYDATLDLREVSDVEHGILRRCWLTNSDISISDDVNHNITIKLTPSPLKVAKVIYNKPATIVFWSDGTKTVVVCDKKDKYDPEKGFYIACAKKLFGNNYQAVGRMNKALDLAVDVTKKDK